MKSKVMTIANHLVKQGMSRSAAMVQAWSVWRNMEIFTYSTSDILRQTGVKLHRIDTKTAGVTHGNRQKLLARLSQYSPKDITIKLQHEQDNAADKNAVQVIAAVKGKGSAVMGYLNRQLAEAIAPKQSVAGRSSTRASRYSPSSRQSPETRRRSSITGST